MGVCALCSGPIRPFIRKKMDSSFWESEVSQGIRLGPSVHNGARMTCRSASLRRRRRRDWIVRGEIRASLRE